MAVWKRGNKWVGRVYVQGERIWIGSHETEDGARLAEITAKRERIMGHENVDAFAARYLDDYNRTTKNGAPRWGERTVMNMDSALRPFRAAFGHKRLRDLTTPDVRPWATSQPQKYVAVARTMMNDALRDGLISRNPFSNLRLEGSRGRRDIDVLTEPELEKLIALAHRSGSFGPTFAAMIAIAGYTGIRPGEMFALTPPDVDLKAEELHVRRSFNGVEMKLPKNGRPRTGLVIPPPAVPWIQQAPRKLGAEFFFESPRGGIFRKPALNYYWQPIRAAFGRPKLAFYELRHAAATLLLERGVTVEDCAWQMGHQDGGALVRRLYGEPHRDADGRRQRIRAAFGKNVVDLADTARLHSEAENG